MSGDAYSAWVDAVHQLGGVATAWPFGGPVPVTDPMSGMVVGENTSQNYGKPAARFPAIVFASIAGGEYPGLGIVIPVANGVQFNVAGTWVYVLASAMTLSTAVDESAQASIGATTAEAEKACAANNNCPTDLEQTIKTVAIGAAVVAGAVLAIKVLNIAKD